MLKNAEEFLQAVNGNDLFVLLKKTFFKGEFICPLDNEVANNEVYLGVMTDLEKAMFLTAVSISEKHLKYYVALGDRCNYNLFFLSRMQEKTMFSLLWATIYARLQEKALKFSSLRIRKNWQIIGFCKETSCFFDDEAHLSFGGLLS